MAKKTTGDDKVKIQELPLEHYLQQKVHKALQGVNATDYQKKTESIVIINLQKQRDRFNTKYPEGEIGSDTFKTRNKTTLFLKNKYEHQAYKNYIKSAENDPTLLDKCLIPELSTITDFIKRDYENQKYSRVAKTLDYFSVFLGFEGWNDAVTYEFDILKKEQEGGGKQVNVESIIGSFRGKIQQQEAYLQNNMKTINEVALNLEAIENEIKNESHKYYRETYFLCQRIYHIRSTYNLAGEEYYLPDWLQGYFIVVGYDELCTLESSRYYVSVLFLSSRNGTLFHKMPNEEKLFESTVGIDFRNSGELMLFFIDEKQPVIYINARLSLAKELKPKINLSYSSNTDTNAEYHSFDATAILKKNIPKEKLMGESLLKTVTGRNLTTDEFEGKLSLLDGIDIEEILQWVADTDFPRFY